MTFADQSWRIKAGFAVAVGLILIRFVLIPFNQWKDDSALSIKLLQKTMCQKKALIGKEHRLDEMLDKAEGSLKEAVSLFYTDFTDTQAIQLHLQKELEQLSLSTGLKIINTDWLYPSEGDIIQAPIKINLEATMEQLVRFIHGIESGKRFLSVDNLKIVSKARSSTLRAELIVSAYGIREKT